LKRNVGSMVYGDKRWHIRVHIIRITLNHFAHEDRLGIFQSSGSVMISREDTLSQRKANKILPAWGISEWHISGISSVVVQSFYHRDALQHFVEPCSHEHLCETLKCCGSWFEHLSPVNE
jgi:hypothetical protein